MTRTATAERILRARLEEAGLEVIEVRQHVPSVTKPGAEVLVVAVRIPAALIDETERAADLMTILRDGGLL